MARELGGSQISALLESVPGIRSVLRSPVADALVQMIRAGAGLEEFRLDSAKELVQYSVRRGLINADEGDELMAEVKAVAKERRARKRKTAGKKAKGGARKAKPAKKTATKSVKPAKKKAAKKNSAKNSAKKAGKNPAKKPGKGKPALRRKR
jgi:polyhydroxyalkanoate synthesis regulator phasin